MSKVTIDFETRSAVSPKDVGAWRYSEHPTTDVICLAVKVDDGEPKIWWPYWVGQILLPLAATGSLKLSGAVLSDEKLKVIVTEADVIEAHNAEFERAMWLNQMVEKHGFTDLPLGKMRCSAAKAAMHSLPRALDKAVKALGLSTEKDMDGHKLMMKMCKPRRLVKAELEELAELYGNSHIDVKEWYEYFKSEDFVHCDGSENAPELGEFCRWHEAPEDIIRLCQYCLQDVEAEHALSNALRDLPKAEQQIWFLDQKINQRGVKVDMPSVRKIISVVQEYESSLLKEMSKLVPGVNSPRQVAKTMAWINEQMPDIGLENLQKPTVSEALERDNLSPNVRRVLELRRNLGKSSVAKYDTLLNMTCEDGRMRGLFMYHGASTGRWAGKGFQPHNLPRKGYKDFDLAIRVITEKPRMCEHLFDNPMEMASGLIRSMVIAEDGKEFICSDFSSIEGRVLAWLAREEYVLKSYREGKCAYCSLASRIHNVPYEEIFEGRAAGVKKYEDMRFEGKTGELACGYQGGEKAIFRFAPDMEKEKREKLVILWRKNRSETKKLWYNLEDAAYEAVVHAPEIFNCNGVRYGVRDNFLCCRLPSGRVLYYYDPQIIEKKIKATKRAVLNADGGIEYVDVPPRKKKVITFMGMNSMNYKWERMSTYGGKLTENCVQAIARDLLRDAMFRLEKAGYEIVMHVHDEVVAEMPVGQGSLDELNKIMSVVPGWARGLPVGADGWVGKRYRK